MSAKWNENLIFCLLFFLFCSFPRALCSPMKSFILARLTRWSFFNFFFTLLSMYVWCFIFTTNTKRLWTRWLVFSIARFNRSSFDKKVISLGFQKAYFLYFILENVRWFWPSDKKKSLSLLQCPFSEFYSGGCANQSCGYRFHHNNLF